MLLLCSAPAFADEADNSLPEQTSEQLKANTREMIRLGAGSEDAAKMTRLMVQNRFQVENAIQAQETVMNALKNGLPAEPVMNKAFEGIAKGVPEGSVVRAMEKTRQRYAYAYEKATGLEQDPDETALTGEVIAEGMAAGLKNEDADRICEQLQTRDRLKDGEGDMKQDRDQIHTLAQESFMTAREMARRGVPSDVAADAVCQALQNNYQAREMQQLRNAFMTNAASGDPVQVANRYTYALRQGMSADDLETAGRYGSGSSGSGMSGGQGASGGADEGGSSSGSGGSDSGSGGGGSGSGESGGSGGNGNGSGGSGSGHGGKK